DSFGALAIASRGVPCDPVSFGVMISAWLSVMWRVLSCTFDCTVASVTRNRNAATLIHRDGSLLIRERFASESSPVQDQSDAEARAALLAIASARAAQNPSASRAWRLAVGQFAPGAPVRETLGISPRMHVAANRLLSAPLEKPRGIADKSANEQRMRRA